MPSAELAHSIGQPSKRPRLCWFILLLLNRVEMVADDLVHLEHVHPGLLEDGLHLVVAADLPLVFGILKIVALDMFPELLHHLWP